MNNVNVIIRRVSRAGMSLVEVMISLAISATLLAAVAAAFSASASAIEINDQFVRASQAARISVNQVMSEIRKAQVGEPGTENWVSDEQIEFTTESGVKRTYALDHATNALMMTVHDPLDPQTVRLAGNINSLKFSTNGDAV